MQSVSFKVFPCWHEAITVFLMSFLVIYLEMDHMPSHLPTRVWKLLLFSVRLNRLPKDEIKSFPSSASNLIACMVRAGLLPFVLLGLVVLDLRLVSLRRSPRLGH